MNVLHSLVYYRPARLPRRPPAGRPSAPPDPDCRGLPRRWRPCVLLVSCRCVPCTPLDSRCAGQPLRYLGGEAKRWTRPSSATPSDVELLLQLYAGLHELDEQGHAIPVARRIVVGLRRRLTLHLPAARRSHFLRWNAPRRPTTSAAPGCGSSIRGRTATAPDVLSSSAAPRERLAGRPEEGVGVEAPDSAHAGRPASPPRRLLPGDHRHAGDLRRAASGRCRVRLAERRRLRWAPDRTSRTLRRREPRPRGESIGYVAGAPRPIPSSGLGRPSRRTSAQRLRERSSWISPAIAVHSTPAGSPTTPTLGPALHPGAALSSSTSASTRLGRPSTMPGCAAPSRWRSTSPASSSSPRVFRPSRPLEHRSARPAARRAARRPAARRGRGGVGCSTTPATAIGPSWGRSS